MEKLTAATLMVKVIDTARLNKEFTERIKTNPCQHCGGTPNYPATTVWETSSKLAIYDGKNPGSIDDEFVGANGDTVRLMFYEHGEKNGQKYFSMVPSYSIAMTHAELEPYVVKTMSAKEFAGDRYGYNPRIQRNEYEMLKAVNK